VDFTTIGSRLPVDHLHGIVEGGDFWVRHVAFRDYLRAHPHAAAEYYDLKGELAVRCSKEDYTQAKRRFIEGILASALGPDVERTAQHRVAPDGSSTPPVRSI
jgi:GrpB-like predicted nucleotidyltransferase (UPF0157 family)